MAKVLLCIRTAIFTKELTDKTKSMAMDLDSLKVQA